MTLLTQLLSKMENLQPFRIVETIKQIDLKQLFKKRYTVCLKGERLRSVCQYSGETNIVESFSNTFSSLWEYIINSN